MTVGDGSIMMNLQELQTISDVGGDIKIFVVNNNGYAIIRRRQQELFRRRTIGTDSSNGVGCPDFSRIADCFNIPYRLIETSESLPEKLVDIFNLDGPVLCEITGVPDQQYIEVRHAKNLSGKFVRRPLEDQWPFLERSQFIDQMIIDLIDQ